MGPRSFAVNEGGERRPHLLGQVGAVLIDEDTENGDIALLGASPVGFNALGAGHAAGSIETQIIALELPAQPFLAEVRSLIEDERVGLDVEEGAVDESHC